MHDLGMSYMYERGTGYPAKEPSLFPHYYIQVSPHARAYLISF